MSNVFKCDACNRGDYAHCAQTVRVFDTPDGPNTYICAGGERQRLIILDRQWKLDDMATQLRKAGYRVEESRTAMGSDRMDDRTDAEIQADYDMRIARLRLESELLAEHP